MLWLPSSRKSSRGRVEGILVLTWTKIQLLCTGSCYQATCSGALEQERAPRGPKPYVKDSDNNLCVQNKTCTSVRRPRLLKHYAQGKKGAATDVLLPKTQIIAAHA